MLRREHFVRGCRSRSCPRGLGWRATRSVSRCARRRRRGMSGRHDRADHERLGRYPATVSAYFYDPPARRRGRSRPATSAFVVAAAPTPSAAQRQGRRLRLLRTLPPWCDRAPLVARACNQGRCARGRKRRCARGRLDTDGCRRPTTGRAPTRVDVRERRSHTSPRGEWPAASVVTSLPRHSLPNVISLTSIETNSGSESDGRRGYTGRPCASVWPGECRQETVKRQSSKPAQPATSSPGIGVAPRRSPGSAGPAGGSPSR